MRIISFLLQPSVKEAIHPHLGSNVGAGHEDDDGGKFDVLSLHFTTVDMYGLPSM